MKVGYMELYSSSAHMANLKKTLDLKKATETYQQ